MSEVTYLGEESKEFQQLKVDRTPTQTILRIDVPKEAKILQVRFDKTEHDEEEPYGFIKAIAKKLHDSPNETLVVGIDNTLEFTFVTESGNVEVNNGSI